MYGAGLGPYRFLFRQDEPKFLIGMTSPSPDSQRPAPAGVAERPRAHASRARPLSPTTATTRTSSSHRPIWRSSSFTTGSWTILRAEGVSVETCSSTRRCGHVRWHYQWLVLHDFVERLTEDRHRCDDPPRGPQVLPVPAPCRTMPLSSSRGQPISAGAQHGARGLQL